MTLLRESFYGRENPALTRELLEEAPGIFNWALEGLDRLRQRGYFVTPSAAREAQRHLEDLASPVGAFVRDRCAVGPAFEIDKDALWGHGRRGASTRAATVPERRPSSPRDLRATVPGLTPVRPRQGETRSHTWRGIELAQQSDGPLTTPDQQDAEDGDREAPTPEDPLNHAGGQGWVRGRIHC
jgi:putative DNA primase/helicase